MEKQLILTGDKINFKGGNYDVRDVDNGARLFQISQPGLYGLHWDPIWVHWEDCELIQRNDQ